MNAPQSNEQWFMVNKWSYQPEAIDGVIRHTEKFLWRGDRRLQRISDWRCYFPTQTDAWEWLESEARARIEAAHQELDRQTARLNQLRANREALSALQENPK